MEGAPILGGEYGVDVRVGGLKEDGSGNALSPDLHECTYGPLGSRRMVKRAPHTSLPSKYSVLRGLGNLTMLSVEGFFTYEGRGHLVLEPASETFKQWVLMTPESEVFIQTTSANVVRLSPLLRTMCLEFAGLIDALIEKNCFPPGLNVDRLYINKIQERPMLKVLLDYNVLQIQSSKDVDSAMALVRGFIDWCCNEKAVTLDSSSCSFRDYFGRHKSPRHLENYPDAWSDAKKTSYIFMIINGNRDAMNLAIIDAKVHFPWIKEGIQAIQVVEDIRRYAAQPPHPTFYNYGPYRAWNYIQMCRNILKSFKIPPNWQVRIPNRTTFLRLMEQWNPRIWTSLYEQIGPLEGEEVKCGV